MSRRRKSSFIGIVGFLFRVFFRGLNEFRVGCIWVRDFFFFGRVVFVWFYVARWESMFCGVFRLFSVRNLGWGCCFYLFRGVS